MIKICENQLDKFKKSYHGYYYNKSGIIFYFNKDKVLIDKVCVYKPIDNYINKRINEITNDLLRLGILEIIEE